MSKIIRNPLFLCVLLAVLAFTCLFVFLPHQAEATDGFHGPAWMAKRPQGIVATTAADGTFTWTFGTAYAGGVIPVVVATVLTGTAADIYNVKVTAVSNTSASIAVTRTTDTTVLTIHLLGIQSAGSTVLNLFAIEP